MRLLRRLAVPASETQLGLALAVAIVVMALMLMALIWQANIIVYQRALIRWMWRWKYGG